MVGFSFPLLKWVRFIRIFLTTGDIASLYNNISGIDPFLSPCLSYATETVPAASRTSTPIFFGATAGFRLLK